MTTPRIRTRDVITAAEKVLGVSAADLTGRRRSVSLSRDRQLAILVAAQVTDQPLKQIARVFNRDHTTGLHAVKCARRRLDESPALMATVARIAAGAAVAAVEWQAKWRAEAERIEERRGAA